MAYKLYAEVRNPMRWDTERILFGTFDTENEARWWAINAKGCWSGDTYYRAHEIIEWVVEETAS